MPKHNRKWVEKVAMEHSSVNSNTMASSSDTKIGETKETRSINNK